MRIVLASGSPYRRALLERLEIPFEVVVPDVDESPLPDEAAHEMARRLAQAKARAGAARASGALVIGSDQVAEVEGLKLGKPGNHANAVRQLREVRGKKVVFHTALCLLNSVSGGMQLASVPTSVQFRLYTDEQIERYLARERAYDCAGSARIEGLGIALVEGLSSEDPTALIGLPLMQVVTMLANEGVHVL